MGTQENGVVTNILSNLPTPKAIVSSTNTNPIFVTTAPHGMTNQDLVSINGHAGNTNANGVWVATVISSTTYTIPQTGNGVGGATGSSQSLAVGPTFTIPSDGVDDENAASVGVPFNALADRTAFLGYQLGYIKLAAHLETQLSVDTPLDWDGFTPSTMTDAAWNDLTGATVFTPAALSPQGAIQANDILRFDLDVSCSYLETASHFSSVSIWYSVTPPGGADSYAIVPSSQRVISSCQFVNPETHPIRMSGFVTAAPNAGTLKVKVRGRPVNHATISLWSFISSVTLIVDVYRGGGMPQ
jgi:hypothetical protein